MPRSRPLLPALLLLLAAGCDDSTGPDGGPTALQTTQVSSVVQDEMETDVDAVLIEAAVTPTFVVASPLLRDGGSSGLADVVAPCVAPTNTTDTDGDGIYDDATITFTAPPCTRVNRRGGTVALTGVLRIQDPTPTVAGFAYSNTLTGLTFSFTGGGVAARNYTVSRTGTRSVSVSGAGLTFASDMSITRTFNVGAPALVEKVWNVSYTPAAGSALVAGQPLPSGTFSATGSVDWTRGAETFALDITTSTPLSYDASCNAAQRIVAGELRAHGSFNGRDGYLRMRWTACGVEPSVIFVRT